VWRRGEQSGRKGALDERDRTVRPLPGTRCRTRQPGPGDPAGCAERLVGALRALDGYYGAQEQVLIHALGDVERHLALREALAPTAQCMERVEEELAGDWRAEPRDERLSNAVIAHALDFWTWRSLAGRGLEASEAADLTARLTRTAFPGKRAS
jgi:hypothetical protein